MKTLQMDINGHDTTIKTRQMIEFKIKQRLGHEHAIEGRMLKIEKPFVVTVQADPWNSELHQFATKEEAMEFVANITA